MADPLATTETFYADLAYLQRMVAECRHGFKMLGASASIVNLPWSEEVSARLQLASLLGTKSSGDTDECIRLAMLTLLTYMAQLNEM